MIDAQRLVIPVASCRNDVAASCRYEDSLYQSSFIAALTQFKRQYGAMRNTLIRALNFPADDFQIVSTDRKSLERFPVLWIVMRRQATKIETKNSEKIPRDANNGVYFLHLLKNCENVPPKKDFYSLETVLL